MNIHAFFTRSFQGLYIFFLSMCLLWVGCAGDPDFPFGDRPDLEFISISPQEVKAIRDSIVIQVGFTDGNGDLGDSDNQVQNLTLIDNRVNDMNNPITPEAAIINFSLPDLTPNTRNPAIQGIITIELVQTGVRRDRVGLELPVDSTSFDIYVQDRRGNVSDTVTTDVIRILR